MSITLDQAKAVVERARQLIRANADFSDLAGFDVYAFETVEEARDYRPGTWESVGILPPDDQIHVKMNLPAILDEERALEAVLRGVGFGLYRLLYIDSRNRWDGEYDGAEPTVEGFANEFLMLVTGRRDLMFYEELFLELAAKAN